MRVCIAAPIATDDVAPLLSCGGVDLPAGYAGAPLTAVLIAELLAQGCEVVGITVDYKLPADAPTAVATGPRFEYRVLPGRKRAWRFNDARPGRALDLFSVERRRISAAIAEAEPDVVHAHWAYEFALGALASGVPHVVTCHDAPQEVLRFRPGPYRLARYFMARQAMGQARSVTAVSEYLARAIGSAVQVPVAVVPNPVAPWVLDCGMARNLPRSRRIAMVCNGWGRRKNPVPALRAFVELRQIWPEVTLHLYGADFGPGQAAQCWAARAGISEGMVFRGPMTHRALIAELATADLLLHPALEESFGVVVAEAMALGLPVVAGSTSGAVPWVVGAGEQGVSACAVLVDVRDPGAMARGVQAAFGPGYAAMSASGLARARKMYSPPAVAARYQALYGAAVAEQGGGGAGSPSIPWHTSWRC